jgi:hypothetical protein
MVRYHNLKAKAKDKIIKDYTLNNHQVRLYVDPNSSPHHHAPTTVGNPRSVMLLRKASVAQPPVTPDRPSPSLTQNQLSSVKKSINNNN